MEKEKTLAVRKLENDVVKHSPGAEFWLLMGKDLGEIRTAMADIRSAFQGFLAGEFKEVRTRLDCVDKRQDDLDKRLDRAITKISIVTSVAVGGWTFAQVVLHYFKVL